MSATSAQPITGHASQPASLGAVAILVGALALGAVGLAIGQGYKSAPAAGVVPADVQAALYAQRMGEKEPLFSAEDSLLIQRSGEFKDRGSDAATGFPSPVSGQGTIERSPQRGHHPR